MQRRDRPQHWWTEMRWKRGTQAWLRSGKIQSMFSWEVASTLHLDPEVAMRTVMRRDSYY